MPKTNGSHARASKELRHVTRLLNEEVIPKIRSLRMPAQEDGHVTSPRPGEPSQPQDPVEADPEDAGAAPARTTAVAARAGGVAVRPGVRIGPVGRLLLQILNRYPKRGEIAISSGYRPQEGRSHHAGLSYNGSPTAALDIVAAGPARMRDVARWLYTSFAGNTVELIHTTPFRDDNGFYVKNQVKHPGGGPYGPQTRREHLDHVHFATSKALAQRILGGRRAPRVTARAGAPSAPVWGWDASGHDWKRGPMDLTAAKKDGISFFTHKCSEGHTFQAAEYAKGLQRARAARIPVLGAYHVLWPGNPVKEARFFFNLVNAKTPWWKHVPWIWQLDAERFKGMPRPPSPAECKTFLDELKRLAGGRGYFIAYAPRWLYGDTFRIGCDLWASNYTGSGAPRNFKEQYKGVPQTSWRPYSGRKPRILQFASDATIGRQRVCDANRFDRSLNELIALTRQSAPRAAAEAAPRVIPMRGRKRSVPSAEESGLVARHG
jgi:Glycosyl hydrolases family 25